MKIDKPNYYLKLKMMSCPRIVTFNGVELESDMNGNSNYSEYPINHFIRNGENIIELLLPNLDYFEGDDANQVNCEVEIRVRGTQNGSQVDHKVVDVVYAPVDVEKVEQTYLNSMSAGKYNYKDESPSVADGKVFDFEAGAVKEGKKYPGGFDLTLERKFTAEVPFPEWGFFRAEKIAGLLETDEEFYALEAEILPLVHKMQKLYADQNLKEILNLTELRSREIDQAFYKADGTTQKDLEESIKHVFDSKFPLSPVSEDNLQLLLSNDGKLVTMVDAGNMRGTIFFKDTINTGFTAYTFYWMKKDGKFIIAR